MLLQICNGNGATLYESTLAQFPFAGNLLNTSPGLLVIAEHVRIAIYSAGSNTVFLGKLTIVQLHHSPSFTEPDSITLFTRTPVLIQGNSLPCSPVLPPPHRPQPHEFVGNLFLCNPSLRVTRVLTSVKMSSFHARYVDLYAPVCSQIINQGHFQLVPVRPRVATNSCTLIWQDTFSGYRQPYSSLCIGLQSSRCNLLKTTTFCLICIDCTPLKIRLLDSLWHFVSRIMSRLEQYVQQGSGRCLPAQPSRQLIYV
jgi:hypothetical protein